MTVLVPETELSQRRLWSVAPSCRALGHAVLQLREFLPELTRRAHERSCTPLVHAVDAAPASGVHADTVAAMGNKASAPEEVGPPPPDEGQLRANLAAAVEQLSALEAAVG